MRELNEVEPVPATREEILAFGLHEIAGLAPGGHLLPEHHARQQIKDYAQRILAAADAAERGAPFFQALGDALNDDAAV